MNTQPSDLEDFEDLAETPQYALCERLICLYGPDQPPDWWRWLLAPGENLWEPSGRICQGPLDQCRAEVERAVAEGFRPILFVPRPTDWPRVYDDLGRFQGFAELYVRGRDDEAMRRLLRGPAPEVVRVSEAEGYLIVPTLEYAKALDEKFTSKLQDLSRVQSVESSRTQIQFLFVSRLNPFRFFSLEPVAQARGWQLRQFYRHQEGKIEESCERPLDFEGTRLDFVAGMQELTAKQAERMLKIPPPELDDVLWQIVQQLARIARRQAEVYLSQAQQKVLSLWIQVREEMEQGFQSPALRTRGDSKAKQKRVSGKAIEGLLQWVAELAATLPEPVPVRLQVRGALRTRGSVSKAEGTPPEVSETVELPLLISGVEPTDEGLTLTLAWAPGKRPDDLSAIRLSVVVNETELDRPEREWAEDGSRLHLRGIPLKAPELAWSWEGEMDAGHLRIRLRQPTGVPG